MAALALAAAAPAAARAQIILSLPTNLTARPGDTITIPLTLTETGNVLDAAHGNGIATVGFAISYDPSLGTVPGSAISLGSLISNPGYGFPPYAGNANESAGQIRTFSAGTPGTPGLPSGTAGPIAQIALTVPVGTAPNSYTLSFNPVIGPTTTTFITDNNFTTYAAGSGLTLMNGALTVSPVPEPGGLFLVGSVVTLVSVARRRSRPVRSTCVVFSRTRAQSAWAGGGALGMPHHGPVPVPPAARSGGVPGPAGSPDGQLAPARRDG